MSMFQSSKEDDASAEQSKSSEAAVYRLAPRCFYACRLIFETLPLVGSCSVGTLCEVLYETL